MARVVVRGTSESHAGGRWQFNILVGECLTRIGLQEQQFHFNKQEELGGEGRLGKVLLFLEPSGSFQPGEIKIRPLLREESCDLKSRMLLVKVKTSAQHRAHPRTFLVHCSVLMLPGEHFLIACRREPWG